MSWLHYAWICWHDAESDGWDTRRDVAVRMLCDVMAGEVPEDKLLSKAESLIDRVRDDFYADQMYAA